MTSNNFGSEKSGTVQLTEHDVLLAEQGQVTDRVKQTWGFTLQQLHEVINNKDYNLITE
jgi:hypothetical protein